MTQEELKIERERVDKIMPRAGVCNKCIVMGTTKDFLLPGGEHCLGLEMGCNCVCRNE